MAKAKTPTLEDFLTALVAEQAALQARVEKLEKSGLPHLRKVEKR